MSAVLFASIVRTDTHDNDNDELISYQSVKGSIT